MKQFFSKMLREGAMSVRWLAILVAYLLGAWYAPSVLVAVKDLNLTMIKTVTSVMGSWGPTTELLLRDGGSERWLMYYELWLVVGLSWWMTRVVVRRLVRPTRPDPKPSAIVPTRVPSPT